MIEIRPLQSHSDWKQIRQLYKTAFPRYERKPLWIVRLKNRQQEADVWIIEQDGVFAGFAITINELDMVLLDYFAISEEKRGCGLGAEALKTLQDCYKGKRLFLEIESVYTSADNLPERQRRKQFYLKNGMTEMGIAVNVYRTDMELLGYDCTVSYQEYVLLYRMSYGDMVVKNLKEVPYPECNYQYLT